MELCLAMGIPHPRILCELITLDEFLDWMALWETSPWGEQRKDMRSAVNSIVGAGSGDKVELFYPYVKDFEEIDYEAQFEYFRKYKAGLN